jgi:sarcosine oxidase subunit alpha
VGAKKPDFVGKRSLAARDAGPGRKQLVGLLTEDPQDVLEEGAQIVADPDQPIPMTMLGHVTSSYHSATLGRSIAMAVIVDGRARWELIHIPMPGRTIRAGSRPAPFSSIPKGAASMSDPIVIVPMAVAPIGLVVEEQAVTAAGATLTALPRPAAGRCVPAP